MKDKRRRIGEIARTLLETTDDQFTFEVIPMEDGGCYFNMRGSRIHYTKKQFDDTPNAEAERRIAAGVVRRLSKLYCPSLSYSVKEHNRDLRTFFEDIAEDCIPEEAREKLFAQIDNIAELTKTPEGRSMAVVQLIRTYLVENFRAVIEEEAV